MANVVTVQQLSQVANAQKTYVDTKDAELKTLVESEATNREASLTQEVTDRNEAIKAASDALKEKIDAIVVPGEASAEEISGIVDLFKVAE